MEILLGRFGGTFTGGQGKMDFISNKRQFIYASILSVLTLLLIFPYQNCANLQLRSDSGKIDHECKVISGRAVCRGLNQYGQLGVGRVDTALSNWNTFMDVKLPTGVTPQKVVSNARASCILSKEGAVWCWGFSGAFGRYLGASTSFDDKAKPCGASAREQCFDNPVPVAGMDQNVTELAGAGNHFCGIKKSEVYCWGEDLAVYDNQGFEVGRKPVNIFSVPDLGLGAVNIAMTPETGCVQFETGAVRCFKKTFFIFDPKRHLKDVPRPKGTASNLNAALTQMDQTF